MNDLDNEILRLKLRKNVIKEELGYNVAELKQSLSPLNLIKEALGLGGGSSSKMQFLEDKDNIFGNGKIFTYLKYLAITISTVKGGASLVKKIKRIFR